MNASKNAMHA